MLADIFAFFPALFCYIAPGLMALVGVWHLANPIGVWKLARAHSESEGLATADAPTAGALKILRARGAFFLVIAIVFFVFSNAFFANKQTTTKADPSSPFPQLEK